MYNNVFNMDDLHELFNLSDVEAIGIGTIITITVITLFVCLLITAFKIVCRWIIFKKAGKQGWEAVVPYYSGWTYYEISGYPGWFALVALAAYIPYIGWAAYIAIIVFDILAGISLAKKFHRSEGFGVLLGLLPIIGLPILAFGSDKYDDSLGEHNNIQK